MKRRITGFMLAPLVAVFAMLALDVIRGGSAASALGSAPLYAAVVYSAAIVIGLPLLILLLKMRLVNIAFFALAGGLVAAIATIQVTGLWGAAPNVLGSFVLQYLDLLFVGVLAGCVFWAIGVSNLTIGSS